MTWFRWWIRRLKDRVQPRPPKRGAIVRFKGHYSAEELMSMIDEGFVLQMIFQHNTSGQILHDGEDTLWKVQTTTDTRFPVVMERCPYPEWTPEHFNKVIA